MSYGERGDNLNLLKHHIKLHFDQCANCSSTGAKFLLFHVSREPADEGVIGRPSDVFVVKLLRNEGGICKAIVEFVAYVCKLRRLFLQGEGKPHAGGRGNGPTLATGILLQCPRIRSRRV